ncbi:hypothetical protein Tco_1146734 [Tanacetum coccineum]
MGDVLKNKSRLVAREYHQEEGIEFEESFALVARLKAIYVDDGQTIIFLGPQISQSPRGIFLNQSKYALEIIKKYGMETSDPVDTPMVEKSKLDVDPQGKSVDPIYYHGMIGSFMYLTSSRPDLVFAVCMCAQYQAKHTEKHLHAVKQIFRYLKDIKRSTSGSMQLLGDRLVSWSSKKQKSTTISSIEAEYIALSGCLPLRYAVITSNIPDPSILTSDTTSSRSKWKMGWLNCTSSEQNISWHSSLPMHWDENDLTFLSTSLE